MSKKYKHIFFDLDRTLWDLERNSDEVMKLLFEERELKKIGIPDYESFNNTYKPINDKLWIYYQRGDIDKATLRFARFHKTLLKFKINNPKLAVTLSELYTHHTPRKGNLVTHCNELLDYLKQHNYNIHIITNGFEEIQHIKMKHSGLTNYIDKLITADAAQAMKPDKIIFDYAMKLTGAKSKTECIMIGDSYEHDIIGAANYGMDQVYYNPTQKRAGKKCTHEISSMKELLAVF
jgi:putative hydrolase of the HAD superfamily